jgi:CRISPR/Cas system-associated exonuclease Cas4 (RecB family)
MDFWDKLKFAALMHDMGKVWDRKHHTQFIIDLMRSLRFLNVADGEIIRLIDKTHNLGNESGEEWLIKVADRKACEIQRLNFADDLIENSITHSNSPTLYYVKNLRSGLSEYVLPEIQKILYVKLREHLIINNLDVSELRKFIKNNHWLDAIKADVKDINDSSLREHLLLTEKILDLIIEFLGDHPTTNYAKLLENKELEEFIQKNLETIKKPVGRPRDLRLLERLIDCVDKNELSVQFKISTEEIKQIIEQDLVMITDGGNESDYKVIVIPVSVLMQYLFCNYQPYVQYIKYGQTQKFVTEDMDKGKDYHQKLANKEKRGKFIEVGDISEAINLSLTTPEKEFVFHECILRAEVIPGIILAGAIDKLTVQNGRLKIVERKFTKMRKELKPFSNEIVQVTAYAVLIKKNFGLGFEKMNCVIEMFDLKEQKILEEYKVEISEESISLLKKHLWDLGSVIIGGKIPKPTENKNKCDGCWLRKKDLCDCTVDS